MTTPPPIPTAIPVTIIGGYLGAGKTTLINELLSTHDGPPLTVLVNDFGAINIDKDLIAAHAGDTLELTNGCVCCSITDSLTDTLLRLTEREEKPHHIVIEASGAAHPAKIALTASNWGGLGTAQSLVLVDALTLTQKERDKYVGALIQDQIREADVLLLTKQDLAPEETKAAARTRLNALNAAALLLASSNEARIISGAMPTAAPRQLEDSKEPQLWSFTLQGGPHERKAFDARLKDIAPHCERIKGTVAYTDGSAEELQWAGERWARQATRASTTRLVFIGAERIDLEAWRGRF
ncbi:MAG: hypothetical protein EP340_09970 [Alphaproteobacteria bacterium]|nr:MAG: hypothetical protein EP340_09970 [Alphaproteobacteria bacterium]